ncbi:MAG: glycosyltransferase family 2 protein [Verrucomicrobia bacterium]|nr:glycosyltransferase family 2 protein [Cytophagales bacterium]
MEKLTVVILNYNGKHHLQTFLPSVVNYSSGFSVIVADNGSTDDSVVFLKEHFPTVKIIALGQNYGFSKGYNMALSQVASEYVVLLNSDVEVSENWIAPLLNLLEKDKNIVACQPKMLAYAQKNQFEYAGAAGGFLDFLGYPFCQGRLFDTMETDTGQYNKTTEIFWASGACMFVRSEVYQKLGGLDDDFFAHMEEIDLCWRMKNAGYKIMYCPQSTIFHLGGGTLNKINSRKTFLNFRNNLATLYKNLPAKRLLPVIFTKLILDGLAGFRFLLKGEFSNFLAVVKAHFNFYGGLGIWHKKRKIIQTFKKTDAVLYPKSIVKAYFLQGKKTFESLNF